MAAADFMAAAVIVGAGTTAAVDSGVMVTPLAHVDPAVDVPSAAVHVPTVVAAEASAVADVPTVEAVEAPVVVNVPSVAADAPMVAVDTPLAGAVTVAEAMEVDAGNIHQ